MAIPSPPKSLNVPVSADDHVLGAPHARVTIVEYGDFECPSCKLAVAAPVMLLERFKNKIRFVYRHFPLEQAHPHALHAAEASEAAAAQGKFWPMHDLLFANQSHLKDADLQRYAADLGLDTVRFAAEMGDHIYLQKVREQAEGGRRNHLRATPSFYVDGELIDVSFGLDRLHDAATAAASRIHS